MGNWHTRSPEAIAAELRADLENGLKSSEIQEKLLKYGPNLIKAKELTPLWTIFLEQFKDTMILVLLVAAVVSGLIGEAKDAVMIIIIVLINAAIGTAQQSRAEQAIAALKKLAAPLAVAVRDGKPQKIASAGLVPGDIVLIEAGNYVPADLRLVKSYGLKIDESALTGESVPAEKSAETLAAPELPVGDRSDLAFSGTVVTYGRARGVVVATGMDTETGRIAQLIEGGEEAATPLQQRFGELGKWLAGCALFVCLIVFLAGIGRGEKVIGMFLTAVSLAVAAIPESLPAVVAISLALGAIRLARKKALVRRLAAVETLGSTTVICTDKTGTLTQNQMTVKELVPFRDDGRALLLKAGALCNDATAELGDPTEKALVLAAANAGLVKRDLELEYPRHQELPFDSARKMMTTLHRTANSDYLAFTKGALEIVVEKARLAAADKQRVLAASKQHEEAGERVLGLAYRRYPQHPPLLEENELEFLGYVVMSDPPRPEARRAVELCRQAGVRVVMITGDHRVTALAIAKELGIDPANVHARVAPEDKLKIVELLKSRGEIVAMTGDGVNDAPALKRADIGIAMGESGSDVARGAADLVLTDDNFATIVAAVEEGRGIYDNILKFVRYMLSTNSGEVLTMFLALLLRLPLPLLPLQILWVNLVTDGLPAIALSAEPLEQDVMRRPPRAPQQSILAGGLLWSMAGIGLLMAAGTLWLFQLNLGWAGIDKARTVAFTVLSLLQMAHVLNCRSLDRSLFKLGLFSNRYLAWAILSTIVLQALVIYVPFLQYAFRTVPLNVADWLMIGAVAFSPIAVVEARKFITRRRS